MNVSDVFKKQENVSEQRIKEIKDLSQRHAFRSMTEVIDFGIEWQKATGRILSHYEDTKNLGWLKKMDVKRRKQEKEILQAKGELRRGAAGKTR